MRADAWGIELPGLPWVPGAASEQPHRFMSWFFDRYPTEYQEKWLTQNALNGYTHGILSVLDSMGPTDRSQIVNPAGDGPPGNGQTLEQFVATCLRFKAAGLYPVVFLGSKAFQPRDQSVAQWLASVDPIMDALIAADAAEEFVPGWEWDLFNVPGRITIDVAKHVGQRAHAAGKSCWLHFSTEKTSWFENREPRGRHGFWNDLGSDVDGILYQADAGWDIGEIQARIVDTLKQFAQQGDRHKLRAFELTAIRQFTQDRPNEDDANLVSFLACCTKGPALARVWGYGNGARRLDGSPL